METKFSLPTNFSDSVMYIPVKLGEDGVIEFPCIGEHIYSSLYWASEFLRRNPVKGARVMVVSLNQAPYLIEVGE